MTCCRFCEPRRTCCSRIRRTRSPNTMPRNWPLGPSSLPVWTRWLPSVRPRAGKGSRCSMRTGKLAEAKALHMEQGRLLTTEIGKVLTEVIDLNNQYMQETRHQAEAQYDTMRNMLLIAAAAVLLIGVAAGI